MDTETSKYRDLFDATFKDIQKENAQLENLNILVTGKSGVGKSTLINTVFGEELAKTGIGKPVTEKIQLIESEGFPVRIYDTVGFELEKTGFDISGVIKSSKENEIKKLIKKVQKSETKEDDIHVVWYLISGTSARIEKPEIDFINWMIKQKLPVIVGLTKSYDKKEAQLLKKEIKKLSPDISNIVLILAKSSKTAKAFGIERLIDYTFELIPEVLQASFVHSQEASLKLKREEASKIVTSNMAANFSAGFSTSELSDGPLMIETQKEMLAKITSTYGIEVDKKQVETALMSIIGVFGALFAGKKIAETVLKFFPTIGKLGGGLISGGVGMVITGALGYAYIGLMELVSLGKVNLSEITPKELTDILIELLPKYLSK